MRWVSRRLLWANAAIALLGVVTILVGLFWVGNRPVTCRGVEMRPGDVCHKSDFDDLESETVQTYEQRRASARASRPTVIGLGVGLVGFAGAVTWLAAQPRPRDAEDLD